MQNLKLEQTVLGCMITDYECSRECGLLLEEDFTGDLHITILNAIKQIVQEKQQPDYMTIYQTLNQKIDLTFLVDLTENIPTTANFKNYVKQLKDVTVKRKLIRLADEIKTSDKAGEELSEYVESQVFGIRENVQTEDFTNAKDEILSVVDEVEQTYMNEGLSGISTGYPALDKMTDGLQKANLIYLAARPSMGKTALALNISQNIANNGGTVAFYSIEMAKNELLKRMLFSEAILSQEKLKEKDLNDNDWQKIHGAANQIYRSNVHITDKSSLTVPQMTSMARKLKRQKGLDLVVIDYLQLLRSNEGNTRREQVETVSRNLKAMAKELDVPVMVISSLSRANESRSDKRPMLSDLRETGQIEYDADLVIFIHREEYYNPTPENKGKAEIIFAKQRNGAVGVARLGFIKECTRFVDYKSILRGN
ncbi:replicative DNA helicase [Dethiothermospora halolimnae]|uniref:replicative DNA helicase n=1 Tax=Dethiothermospora halolimnae TaxID=3114390 RepID=UPI003CCC2CA3